MNGDHFIETTSKEIGMRALTPEPGPRIKRGWLRVILFLIAWLAVLAISQIIAVIAIAAVTGMGFAEIGQLNAEPNQALPFIMVFTFFAAVGSLLLTWIFRRFIDRKSLKSLGFAINGKAADSLLGFGLGFFLISFGFISLMMMGNLSISGYRFDEIFLLSSFILFILVAINEEVVIRGYILNNLMQSLNKYLALFISALVFTIFHLANPNLTWMAVLNLVISGLLIGVYYIHVKNLWFPIMLHLSWNFFQGPVFGFEVSGLDINSIIIQEISGREILTGGDFGFEGSILLTLSLFFSIMAVHFYYQSSADAPESWPCDEIGTA